MVFNLVTAFPNFYTSFLQTSLIKKAIDKNFITFNVVDLKLFGKGRYKKIDDTPYGGGTGMVIRVDVVDQALKSITNKGTVILMCPTGTQFTQNYANRLAHNSKNITIISGRFEGFDKRVYSLVDKVISVGPYVTMGGEAPSLILIESISRLIPGVIGNINSTIEESFSNKYKKEYPLYTKPEVYNNSAVPSVLLSGNHKEIENWRIKNGRLKI